MEIVIFKKDNLRFGLILGLVAPILSLVVYYFIKFYPVLTIGARLKRALKGFRMFAQASANRFIAAASAR